MSIHKPTDRFLPVGAGATMAEGRSLNLAKGVFGIFQEGGENQDGAKAVSSFNGLPTTTKFRLRLGTAARGIDRTQTNKAWSSFPFALKDVVDVRVSAPQRTEQEVDEVIIGYDGNDDATSLVYEKGRNYKFNFELEGGHLSQAGYPNGKVNASVIIDIDACSPEGMTSDCETCDPCASVDCLEPTLRAIEILKNTRLRGGLPLSDFVEITPVRKGNDAATAAKVAYDFYCLEICDTGDDNALALVQAQYPSIKLEKTGTSGMNSQYQMILPNSDGAPDDYAVSIPSLIKGCEDALAGYTEVEGGLVYAVTLEDDGVDLKATVQALPNAVDDTAVKGQGQINGQGFYTVMLTAALTDDEFNTFVAANPTATVQNLGAVDGVWTNSTVTETAWTECGTCEMTSQDYIISLEDTKCGDSRLAELITAYPTLTVGIDETSVITPVGTSGTATVSIDGNDYTMTFDTDLGTTISAFVAAEAANVLADTGYVLTGDATTLTVAAFNTGTTVVTVANATGDLAGAVVTANITSAGCRAKYKATTLSNMVCEECDPVFEDYFTTEAPSVFDNTEWVLDPNSESVEVSGDCKCGIRVKGKVFEIHPDETLKYEIGFIDESVKVRVSGGYMTEVGEGIGEIVDEPFTVTTVSIWKPRTHMGGSFWKEEDKSFQFFGGEDVNHSSLLERKLKGHESAFIANKQYVQYSIVLRRDFYAQSTGARSEDNLIYHVCAPVGQHMDVETLVNNLASSAGLPMVKAFAG